MLSLHRGHLRSQRLKARIGQPGPRSDVLDANGRHIGGQSQRPDLVQARRDGERKRPVEGVACTEGVPGNDSGGLDGACIMLGPPPDRSRAVGESRERNAHRQQRLRRLLDAGTARNGEIARADGGVDAVKNVGEGRLPAAAVVDDRDARCTGRSHGSASQTGEMTIDQEDISGTDQGGGPSAPPHRPVLRFGTPRIVHRWRRAR